METVSIFVSLFCLRLCVLDPVDLLFGNICIVMTLLCSCVVKLILPTSRWQNLVIGICFLDLPIIDSQPVWIQNIHRSTHLLISVDLFATSYQSPTLSQMWCYSTDMLALENLNLQWSVQTDWIRYIGYFGILFIAGFQTVVKRRPPSVVHPILTNTPPRNVHLIAQLFPWL